MANVRTKEQIVAEIKDRLEGADLVVLADLIGLTVAENRKMRAGVRSANGRLKVYKNTLIGRAVDESGLEGDAEGLKARLKGSTALAFASKDGPIALSKALTDFAKDNERFQVKCGFFNGKLMEPESVAILGKLGSKEELLGRLVSCLIGPVAQLNHAINGPIVNLVLTLKAIAEKQGGEAA